MDKESLPRDERGRYRQWTACDACGRPVDTERDGCFYTDAEVCGGSDDPGFYLCGRKRCIERRENWGTVEARRARYTEQRRLNDAAAAAAAGRQGERPQLCRPAAPPKFAPEWLAKIPRRFLADMVWGLANRCAGDDYDAILAVVREEAEIQVCHDPAKRDGVSKKLRERLGLRG